MVRAVGQDSFQPKIGFKTRYGLVANPFAEGNASNQGLGRLQINSNRYYRRVKVANLNVDDTGNTFAGVLQGKYRVYIDPYSSNLAADQYYVVGYKGSSPYDAGLFYCPYVPLQMVRAVGENSFQPKIGFKTRYGLVANPFAEGNASNQGLGRLKTNSNRYYRRVKVQNLM